MSKTVESKKPKPSPKKRLTIRLDIETIKLVDHEAKVLHFSRQHMMESVVKGRYSGLSPEQRDAQIAQRLNQVDNRQKTIENHLRIVSETQALFVRMWLSTTMEMPEDQKKTIQGQSQKRYERFVDILQKRIDKGQTLVNEVNKDTPVMDRDLE